MVRKENSIKSDKYLTKALSVCGAKITFIFHKLVAVPYENWPKAWHPSQFRRIEVIFSSAQTTSPLFNVGVQDEIAQALWCQDYKDYPRSVQGPLGQHLTMLGAQCGARYEIRWPYNLYSQDSEVKEMSQQKKKKHWQWEDRKKIYVIFVKLFQVYLCIYLKLNQGRQLQ